MMQILMSINIGLNSNCVSLFTRLFDFLQMQVVACKYLALGSCVVPTVGSLWLFFSRPFSNGKDDNFVHHHAVRLVDSARIGSSTFLFSEIENQVL
jgi:hypothetical protein